MSAAHQDPDRRHTLEEFEAMDFGDRFVELIDGRIAVRPASENDIHGLIIENFSFWMRIALVACKSPSCRPITTSGLRIRGYDHGLPNDNNLGPDLAIKCRYPGGFWIPSMVVEVLSEFDSAEKMADKLRAYKAVPSVMDVIYFSQTKHYAVHHRRRAGEWLTGLGLVGPKVEINIERWNARIRLEQVYEMAFPEEQSCAAPHEDAGS